MILFIRSSLPALISRLFHKGIGFHPELVRAFQRHRLSLDLPALGGFGGHPYAGAAFLRPFQFRAAHPILLPAPVGKFVVEQSPAIRAVQLPA